MLASKRTVIVRSDVLAGACSATLRGPAEAGERAEHAIEGRSGESGADHGRNEHGAGSGGEAEAGALRAGAALRRFHHPPPGVPSGAPPPNLTRVSA